MAAFIELVAGTWLETEDEDAGREAEMLVHLLTQGVFDALIALALFQVAPGGGQHDRVAWDRDRQLERTREAELEAEDPREWGSPGWSEWRQEISGRAKRDVVRRKWEVGELPAQFEHRLSFLYAELFVTKLAQVGRTLRTLAALALGDSTDELSAAHDQYSASLPALKAVRDSVEHAEDRLRGRNKKGAPLTLAPVVNGVVHAPGGGALLAGMLNNDSFGWTTDDGTYQEIAVSDDTLEIARAAVQRALDALPWKSHGYPRYLPY
jgi:hypothetical protein